MNNDSEVDKLIHKYERYLSKGNQNIKELSDLNYSTEAQKFLNWAWEQILKDLYVLSEKYKHDLKTRRH